MYRDDSKKLTPVMRQYRDAKNAYPDAILFFRLGDFYEMFNDDAVVAARELSLTLTSRNKGAADEVPMAGVPHHSAHNYLARLLARGHKVAICEQMADPSKVKGIVPRKVVRVLTPGLLTDSDQLEARQNNFLCAVDAHVDGTAFGLALLDLSTGELLACELPSRSIVLAEIARADPAETLLPPEMADFDRAIRDAAPRTALRTDAALDDPEVPTNLNDGLAARLYDDARRHLSSNAIRAAARALRFAKHYLPDATLPVQRIARYDPSASMHIDETAQMHLELVRGADGSTESSLLAVLDATVTSPGARTLRRRLLAPLTDVRAIRRRLDAVELFVQHPRAREELREALRRVGDLERLAVRASLGETTPRELGVLRTSLAAVPTAHAAIESIPSGHEASLQASLNLDVDLLQNLRNVLEAALVDDPPARKGDGLVFREGYDRELDELAGLKKNGSELIAQMEARLRRDTEIGSLKIKFTRAFGWYIEVTKSHLTKVPEQWRRRQTLTSAERYLNDELEELADKLMTAEERYAEREAELLGELVSTVAEQSEALRRLGAAVAEWDVASALAEVAHRRDFSRPDVNTGDKLALTDARHPVVESYVAAGSFVPNDTVLDLEGERLWIITGPNMAGKSTLMRQVALNTILAQMGSFVAAREASIGVVDRVLSRVGASDNLARGESTFMVEMRETAAILRDATRRSLVILDEIGRGTSTYDGLAIAWAVTEYLYARVGCRAMFATHYHELTELADRHDGIANYSVSAREHGGSIVFLHRLTRGAVSKSYGIAVARLAGLPDALLQRATAILEALEQETHVAGGPGSRPRRGQLELFRRGSEPTASIQREAPDAAPKVPAHLQAVADRLRQLDVNRITPLEALSLLADLKRLAD